MSPPTTYPLGSTAEHRLAFIAGDPVGGASLLPDLADMWWLEGVLPNVVETDRMELDL